MRPIGQSITLWRLHRGMTQGALAAASSVSRPNLSAIEQGGRDMTLQTLRRIASALGVGAGALIDGVGPKPEYTPIDKNRHSLDRIARLAAGQSVRASNREKRIAQALASIMKSKTGQKRTGPKRVRTVRSAERTILRLKTDLGQEMFRHLVRRVEKNLASAGAAHE